jgi:hypothetical protein
MGIGERDRFDRSSLDQRKAQRLRLVIILQTGRIYRLSGSQPWA